MERKVSIVRAKMNNTNSAIEEDSIEFECDVMSLKANVPIRKRTTLTMKKGDA